MLWVVENTTLQISNMDIFWGQISDSLKNNPAVDILHSKSLYLPAGPSDYWGGDLLPMPSYGQQSMVDSLEQSQR